MIEVEAKDFAGNSRKKKVEMPHIRQFENFGKKLYEKGIIVSANYYAFISRSSPMGRFRAHGSTSYSG